MIKAIGFRQIVFSINCLGASLLALFIAFSLNLQTPSWAMTTVYLTSQPLSGVLRAKAVYRVIGTVIGGIAMVAIVPNLIDAPELTTIAIILWVALCLYISLFDRTPRSYAFMLSGYTAALIGFPSVLAPATVFDTAISRVEEIAIGVVCAALVHSLIFPNSALGTFNEKLKTVLVAARGWLADGLAKERTPEADLARRHIAADITELYLLGTSLKYDTAPVQLDINTIRAFDRQVVALLPLLSAVEDRLALLRRLGQLPAPLARVVSDVHEWIETKDAGDRRRAEELRRACLATAPAIGPDSSWADLLTNNVTARLAELVDSWQNCLDLAAYIADPLRRSNRDVPAMPARFAVKSLHRDPGMALLSAVSAALAMGVCSFFWIVTAWPEGAGAVAIAAVVCSLLATLDDPTPPMRYLAITLFFCIPLVTIYQFFILPAIDGFTLLAVVLAIVLIPAGILLAIPPLALLGLSIALAFSIELGIQPSYGVDFATLLNSDSAFVVGGFAALVVTGLLRVVGVDASRRRILRAGWRDLADVADRRKPATREEWASRMLDRVGLLLYRRAASQSDARWRFDDALDDLRIGVNVIEAQDLAAHSSAAGQAAVATMLRGIAAHFRGLARDRIRPLGSDLLGQIDLAIGEAAALGATAQAGLAALVGLRCSLYPDAPAYTPARRSAVIAPPGPLPPRGESVNAENGAAP